MRILSQDGKFDFPYEKVCLEVSDSGKVFAQGEVWGTTPDNYIEIARYENENKAKKAMEMLRETYCGNLHIYVDQFVLMAQHYASRLELLKLLNEAVEHVKYFRFPSDDEVEV